MFIKLKNTWWRHQMETFSALLELCMVNPSDTGGFSHPNKANDAEVSCFYDVQLNKRMSKQLGCWWFETPWRSSWGHCSEFDNIYWTYDVPNNFHLISISKQSTNVPCTVFTLYIFADLCGLFIHQLLFYSAIRPCSVVRSEPNHNKT